MAKKSGIIEEKINIYSWKRGAARGAKVSAQVFGEELEKIGTRNTAEQVLAHAENEDSPIHAMFEWDDSVAGHKYRLERARLYLRSISHKVEVKYIHPKYPVPKSTPVSVKKTRTLTSPPVPTRIHINTPKSGSVYVSQEEIRSDKDAHNSALQECLRAMISFRRKYAMLSELDEIWAAFDAACAKYMQQAVA